MQRFIKTSLAVAAALAATSGAQAADIPIKAPPLAAAWSWSGFYIGANAGGFRARAETDSPIANTACGTCYIPSVIADINAQRSKSLSDSGFIGGLQAGFNGQAGTWLFGVEADINSLRASAENITSAFFTGFPGPGTPPTYTNTVTTSWVATVRGRVGVTFDRVLAYATGGIAVTDITYTHRFVEGVFAGSSSGVQTATSSTRGGVAFGAGIEFAWSPNLSFKAEYLHLDFGNVYSTGFVVFPGGVGGSQFSSTGDLRIDIARVGVNYRWGESPVVARY